MNAGLKFLLKISGPFCNIQNPLQFYKGNTQWSRMIFFQRKSVWEKEKKRKIFNKRIKEDFKGLWISWPRKLKVTQVHQVFSLNNSWMQQTYSKHKNINTTGSCEDEIVLCFLHEWKDLEDKNICMRTFRNRKRMKNMGARNLRIKHPIYPPLKCRIIAPLK